jgi:hypothetical protein
MSLRKAINAKCKECIYDSYQRGNWRQQAQACTAPGCSLFPVRPTSCSENSQFGPFFDAITGEPTQWLANPKGSNF